MAGGLQRAFKAAIFIFLMFGFAIVYNVLISSDQRLTDGSISTFERKLKNTSLAPSDYSYLININFSFPMLPLVCESKEPLLIILVHSSVNNFNKRRVIRSTWGRNEDDVKVLFLVGTTENQNITLQLEEENKQHYDLLQGNFIDSYHNLTYKHVMALKYVVYHCPKAKFMLKLDDDVFLNIQNMKKFIQVFKCQGEIPKKIICSRMNGNPVLRGGKWGVSVTEYPDSFYPIHCSGFAVLYPYDVLCMLYAEAQKSKFFWIDDVFVSGILAKKSNVTHIGFGKLVLTNNDVSNIVDLSFTNITKPFLFGRINLNEKQITNLWKFVVSHPPKATILDYLDY